MIKMLGSEVNKNAKVCIEKTVKTLEREKGATPTLGVVTIGDFRSPFVRQIEKKCAEMGINCDTTHCRKTEIAEVLRGLNDSRRIHGIVFAAAPDLPREYVLSVNRKILFAKNIDNPMDEPCVATACIKMAYYYTAETLFGKNVAIVGRSPLVGLPIARAFVRRGANVTVCNPHHEALCEITGNADLLVTATGVPGTIRGEHVRAGQYVIDVGCRVSKSGITGDVREDEVSGVVEGLTPPIDGVGAVTVMEVLERAVNLAWMIE